MTDSNALFDIAASGLRTQSTRMRVIAENVANAASTGKTPEEAPYRRRVPVFDAQFDGELNAYMARVSRTTVDRSDFKERYEPGHPAADANGMVKYPNVQSLLEMMDMRQAQRAYEANLSVIDTGKAMVSSTLQLLRR